MEQQNHPKLLRHDGQGGKGNKYKANLGIRQPTLMPALLHLPTASGTAARGGSIMDMRPTKQRFSVGKFTSSQSNAKPSGNWSSGRLSWLKPDHKWSWENHVKFHFMQWLSNGPLVLSLGGNMTCPYVYQQRKHP